ncbi:hypothetical protein THAOC_14934 [Thalassiosira oceanica]|uniref:Histone deacetylase domain-containing protein n=1 Tax=Thalassiosira oceanica TaxID=159749 RepID=K0SH83_THAOC|nr:hypothetical protein THAOC_14934 [Thalassiosira oceanica]|eukprot:EJK64344.1 hypothetical protein THAOC_14934 [Thalassiosira oceanica]
MQKYRKVRLAVQEKVARLSDEERSRVDCEFRVSPLATKEQLITTHDETYVDRYLEGKMTEAEIRNTGMRAPIRLLLRYFRILDARLEPDIYASPTVIGFPWSLQHVNRSLSSVGGTVAAACAVCEYEMRQSKDDPRPNWGAHIAGGTHHAFSDFGEGFCIFSDIAVAANVLLDKFPSIKRILIIDLDVHQGNGNAVLFQGDDRVQTFSMHCAGNFFSKKEKSDLDVELPIGCDDSTYLGTLSHWLRRIEEHEFSNTSPSQKKFDFIFFQSGVDILKEDRLGKLEVTKEGVSTRNRMVFDFAQRLGCPLVICMGGGYPRDDWEPIIEAHTDVYWEAYKYLSSWSLT